MQYAPVPDGITVWTGGPCTRAHMASFSKHRRERKLPVKRESCIPPVICLVVFLWRPPGAAADAPRVSGKAELVRTDARWKVYRVPGQWAAGFLWPTREATDLARAFGPLMREARIGKRTGFVSSFVREDRDLARRLYALLKPGQTYEALYSYYAVDKKTKSMICPFVVAPVPRGDGADGAGGPATPKADSGEPVVPWPVVIGARLPVEKGAPWVYFNAADAPLPAELKGAARGIVEDWTEFRRMVARVNATVTDVEKSWPKPQSQEPRVESGDADRVTPPGRPAGSADSRSDDQATPTGLPAVETDMARWRRALETVEEPARRQWLREALRDLEFERDLLVGLQKSNKEVTLENLWALFGMKVDKAPTGVVSLERDGKLLLTDRAHPAVRRATRYLLSRARLDYAGAARFVSPQCQRMIARLRAREKFMAYCRDEVAKGNMQTPASAVRRVNIDLVAHGEFELGGETWCETFFVEVVEVPATRHVSLTMRDLLLRRIDGAWYVTDDFRNLAYRKRLMGEWWPGRVDSREEFDRSLAQMRKVPLVKARVLPVMLEYRQLWDDKGEE